MSGVAREFQVDSEERSGSSFMDEGMESVDGALASSFDEAESGSTSADEDILPAHMAAADPRRMLLINEEAWWALDIKIAIEQDLELVNLSDFLYAQLAIICKNDVEDALRRARIMQRIRNEYEILERLDQGCLALKEMIEIQRGLLLSFQFDADSSAYTLVHDLPKCNTTVLTSADCVEKWMVGLYYIFHTLCPDLESIRRGFKCVAKCEGMDHTKLQGLNQLKDTFTELLSIYPFSGKLLHYHSDSASLAMATTMWKKTLPLDFWKRFIVECTNDTWINSLFSDGPAVEVVDADQRLLQAMTATLRLRFENVRTFTLTRNSYNLQQEN
jgi:hypothetical protein